MPASRRAVASLASVGVVEHIHVAATAGAPMRSVAEVRALKGVGLTGDRYAAAAGYWGDGKVSRDLTLVEAETLEDLERSYRLRLEPGATRRNVTTRGVDLNSLLRRMFRAPTCASRVGTWSPPSG
jgi:MOSC domain-containing protein YiiM